MDAQTANYGQPVLFYQLESQTEGRSSQRALPPAPLATKHHLYPAMYAHMMPTPVASPQPVHHRTSSFIEKQPAALFPIDTEVSPATPALSTSGSSDGSPPSTCGFLPTPVSGMTPSPESLVGVKQGCEGEVLSEILAGAEFGRCSSPPLTPSEYHPPTPKDPHTDDRRSSSFVTARWPRKRLAK